MKAGKNKKIIKEQIDGIYKHAARIEKDFDMEVIHDFRVSVKSLRSWLRMLRMDMGDTEIKLTGKFKDVYHVAGGIRNIQVETDMLAEYSYLLPHYVRHQKQLLENVKHEWKKNYDEKVIHTLHDRLSGIDYKTIYPVIITTFYNVRMEQIRVICQVPMPSDEQLHTIRKHIKDILYTEQIAKKRWEAAHDEIKKIPVATLGSVATAIGNYNDERLTVEHLSGFSAPGMETDEATAIKNIYDEKTAHLIEEKQRIMEVVRDIIAIA